MPATADRILKRLIQSHFRGCQPRISNMKPVQNYDFAYQVRITGGRAPEQFAKFARVIAIRYTEANTILTFQGTLSPNVEIIFQIHAAVTGEA